MGENNHVFKRGAEALGLPGRWMERSAPGCVGCGTCQQGCGSGGKWSVDKTFLAEAMRTGRVAVHADCRVERIEHVHGRIVAVEGRTIEPQGYTAAGTLRVRARVFVLAAGAIATPRILRANGLGRGPLGEHLRVHPNSGVLARFGHRIEAWRGATQGYYVDAWERGYLMPVSYTHLTLPTNREV